MNNAVLFDLDDTLYAERAYVLSGFAAVARSLAAAHGLTTEDVYGRLESAFLSGVRGDTFNRLLADLALSAEPDRVRELIEVYRGHEPRISLYADSEPTLSRLRKRYRLGLITDGPAEVQRKKVAALGIAPWFESLVFSDDFGREHWKPAPTPFLTALEQLRVEPRRAVYVGDNPKKDFIGARKLGLATVRIVRPDTEHGARVADPGYEPDHVIRDLAELPPWLEDTFGRQ